jgi:ipoprotein LpqH
MTVIGGCSSPPPAPQPPGALPPNTMHVTINGADAGTRHDVRCSQSSWLHTIESGDQKSGVTAMVELGDKTSAQAVAIRDLGGFTGSYWAGSVGNAEAVMLGNTYKLTGTAHGSSTDKPNTEASATFEIRANC